jgi:hypothetical protein
LNEQEDDDDDYDEDEDELLDEVDNNEEAYGEPVSLQWLSLRFLLMAMFCTQGPSHP